MTFYIDQAPTETEVSDALNYLLSNLGSNFISDQSTGVITSNGSVIGYLYQFIHVRYADDFTGVTNFSNSPTNRLYYGLRNASTSTESTNPSDYIWHLATGGFGTTKFLYYYPMGGRQCNFTVSTNPPPSDLWLLDSGSAIDLDVIPVTAIQYTSTQFVPSTLFITRTGSPLTPVFTGVAPKLYLLNKGVTINFVTSQNDTDGAFVNNTWRIGGSSTTGNADIVASNVTIGSPTGATTYALFPAPSAMSASPATLTVPVRYKTASGFVSQLTVAVQQFSFVDVGSNNTTAYLYQWNSTTPGNPNGTSTFTWATNLNSGYTGTNGWLTSLPTNPGTPGLQLWIASQQVVAPTTDVTTTVSWTAGFTVVANTDSNSSKTATATVYQWAATIPSISGSTTYTWSTASYTAPASWSTTITSSPSSGLTLWAASVRLVDATSVLTTSINWATAGIVTTGYSGANGASSRITYARIPSNPTPSGTATTSGNSSFPLSTAFGLTGVTWGATDPNPSSTDSLYQSDGIYDSGTNNTLWGTAYISSLKVGSLSAVSVNTGSLTVTGTIQANTAAISGTGMTGSGMQLLSNGNFALGNATNNIVNNGSGMYIHGFISDIYNGYLPLTSYAGSAVSTYTTQASTPAYVIKSGKISITASGVVGTTSNFAANRRIVTGVNMQALNGATVIFDTNSTYETTYLSGGPYNQNTPSGIVVGCDLSAYIGVSVTFRYTYTTYIMNATSSSIGFAEMSYVNNLLLLLIRETNI